MNQNTAQKTDRTKQPQHMPDGPTPLDGPTPEEALLREVDEAMRQERLNALWDKYGNWIIGGLIAIVGTTAIVSASNTWREGRDKKATATVIAVSEGQMGEGLDTLPRAQRTIAQLLQLGNNEPAAQAVIAQALATDASDEAGQQLGRLLSTRLSDASANEKLTALDALMNEKKSYYKALAAIDAATLAGESLDDPQRAAQYLQIARDAAQGDTSLLQLINRLAPLYPADQTKEAEGQ